MSTAGRNVREWDEYSRWRARLLNDARKHGAFDMVDTSLEIPTRPPSNVRVLHHRPLSRA